MGTRGGRYQRSEGRVLTIGDGSIPGSSREMSFAVVSTQDSTAYDLLTPSGRLITRPPGWNLELI